METINKLSKLNKENNQIKGGFSVLEANQLSKLKGGSGNGFTFNASTCCTINIFWCS